MVLRGWALGCDPSTSAMNCDIDDGVSAYTATGAKLMLPYFLTLKAEVEVAKGQLDQADRDLSAALRCAVDNDIRFYEAELHRVRGKMYSNAGRRDEAQNFLREAIRVAEGQSAASLALRATISLASVIDGADERKEVLGRLRRLVAALEEDPGNADLGTANRILAAVT